ncbi:hypothetical protein APY94_02965 [Thermococcus celericrescens]|uniref:Uncharacterized protein n=1 Tax=Thermococcus celericrescens TaxID=227598 RepID=A0A100XZ74_9EURY|nr:hypothetical protein [Thermococcus celericrescens]KUH34251.1 hypothetical protein APY94_02965 [Thermococcus celericrescens]
MALAKLYLFDDKRSILHAVLGFFSAFLLGWSLLVLVIFTAYEVRENENPTATLGDVVEFLIGYVYGLAFLVWLALGFYI